MSKLCTASCAGCGGTTAVSQATAMGHHPQTLPIQQLLQQQKQSVCLMCAPPGLTPCCSSDAPASAAAAHGRASHGTIMCVCYPLLACLPARPPACYLAAATPSPTGFLATTGALRTCPPTLEDSSSQAGTCWAPTLVAEQHACKCHSVSCITLRCHDDDALWS
jgi:hypothetical protein